MRREAKEKLRDAVEVRVRCGTKLHTIRLEPNGRLVLCDHPKPGAIETAYMLAGLDPSECRCLAVGKAWVEVCRENVRQYGTRRNMTEARKSLPKDLDDEAAKNAKLRSERQKKKSSRELDREDSLVPLYSRDSHTIDERKRRFVMAQARELRGDKEGVTNYYTAGGVTLDGVRGRLRADGHASLSFTCFMRARRLGVTALGVDCRGRALIWNSSWVNEHGHQQGRWEIVEPGESR